MVSTVKTKKIIAAFSDGKYSQSKKILAAFSDGKYSKK